MSAKTINEEFKCKEIIDEDISRDLVFEKLFDSYKYGNLGMFIGAGFSKAVIKSKTQPALNWIELIKKTTKKLKLEFPSEENLVSKSLPEIATILCKILADREQISYNQAKKSFKNTICDLSNWLPDEETEKRFRAILDDISPKWIITTNYDLVLETILTGKCKGLSPFNYLSAPKDIIPIYHFHGTRLDSDSIIITQDDYIPLFRPNEYRQSKLAMTIRESTTLVLGYSLGDMNVLSALDWSKNIYTSDNEYPYEIIQVLRIEESTGEVYKDENGNIVMEISDLESFLRELAEYFSDRKKEEDKKREELEITINKFKDDNSGLVDEFISNSETRAELLKLVFEYEYEIIYYYIEFFKKCTEKVSQKNDYYVSFNLCKLYLEILEDVLITYEYEKISPKLFSIVAEELNEALRHVDINESNIFWNNGYSWGATEKWSAIKRRIPEKTVKELYNYSEQRGLYRLELFMYKILENRT